MGAARRIAGSENALARENWLPGLISGQSFCTVGISHLTTSRRHLATAALRARVVESDSGISHFVLDGICPWVTGGAHADGIVIGATLEDGREILAIVPTDFPGVTAHPGTDLVALSASCTDRVELANVYVTPEMLLAGPVELVMTKGIGGGAGGVQTSTLAVGLSSAATGYLKAESEKRPDLVPVVRELSNEVDAMANEVVRAASDTGSCDLSNLRGRANRLALRTTQAALTAAKGAGYVTGHPAGRWCREALFFLVWSCPQPVSQAHLCELAGLSLD
jgi:alkylation response protein AidB-like acyl-CoA dehydrogenase